MNQLPKIKSATTALTAGGLLFHEFEALQGILVSDNLPALLIDEVTNNQFLKIKSQEARKRIITEIKRRFTVVDIEFWSHWMEFTAEEKRLALLFVVLKTYPIAFDLHFEVTVPNWRAKQFEMDTFSYQMRMDELASQGHVVEKWSATTKKRTISHYMGMLREAGIMKGNVLKLPTGIGMDFWQYMARIANPWFFEACLLNKKERDKYL